jgi:hypothetical protein
MALQPLSAQAPPAPPVPEVLSLTAEQWREDLRFMAAEMEGRHANLFHTMSKEKFRAAVADLDARIPKLQRHQIIVGMMRIAAMVGDGHTRVDPRKDPAFQLPSLPLKLYLFEDGLFVRAAAPEHADLIGAKIEAVGGVPLDEAIRRVSEISSRDNEMGIKKFVPLYLNMPAVLHALEMSPSPGVAVLKLRKGSRVWTQTIAAGAVEPLWPADVDVSLITPQGWVDARKTPDLPLWLQAPLDAHRLVALPDEKVTYAQVNMITNISGQTLGDFGVKIRKQAEANKSRAVIVDFRLAHGGDHSLRHRFVRELVKTEDEDTRLFVLTGRGAFSATEAVLVDLDRLTDAVFVGEPAASKPNSFGDAYRMTMPNSGIAIRSSIYFIQLAGSSSDSWTWVDVAAPLTFSAYAAGQDPALETALSYAPGPALRDQLLEAAKTGGVARVRRALADYRANSANRYQNLELLVRRAAESLAGSNYSEEAYALAQAAAEAFPRSTNTFVALAFIAERAGKTDAARRAAERALELDRNNRQVRSILERSVAK